MSADDLYVEPGPTWDAAVALVGLSTLADHLLVDHQQHAIRFHPDDVPLYLWGSGTQGLWRLLESITHGDLRQIVAHCDPSNKAAISFAVGVLCRQP